MKFIEKNDVSLLSHIIYTIYNTEDLDTMRLEVLELLKYAIPFDTANFYLVETTTKYRDKLTRPINVNRLKNHNVDGVLSAYMDKCCDMDSTHWMCNARKSKAYRSTDLLSESTLENTDYYKEMFEPYDVHFGAQVILAHNNANVGLLSLFRSKEASNFCDTEIFYLDSLKEHLAIRLHQFKFNNSATSHNASLFMEKYRLTPRECEILDMLFKGIESKVIAEKLHISENTLRKHVYNMYHKMNITHRWELFFLS